MHCGIHRNDKLGVRDLFEYVELRGDSWQRFIEERDKADEVEKIREQIQNVE